MMQRKKSKKIVYILLLLAAVGLIFGYYTVLITRPNSSDSASQELVIAPGRGSREIADQLKAEGLIRNALAFKVYVTQQGISSRLQDGRYALARNLSIVQIAEILTRGAGVTREKTLTFIEGWNTHDIAQYLIEQGFAASAQDFFTVIQRKADWWNNYSVLATRPKTQDLEGYLFPDTYRVFSDASIDDIVEKMVAEMDEKFSPALRAEIAKQGKSIHDILTMASILEKEVRTTEERKMVADIFYKRLAIGQALQADSTVNYATGKNTPRASLQDLQVDSPYNTYKYRGLPPGPISNPSLSAIEAAVYPTANDYYYFLTTPEGEVIYSKTLEQHNAAKANHY